MYMKLRVCSPSPQISISSVPASFAVRDLAADRRRRLLAAAVVGAVRPVDVVVARHPRLDAEVVVEVPAHALREELLPAVAVLGHRRVGVLLPQRGHVRTPAGGRRCRRTPTRSRSAARRPASLPAISRCVLISTEIMHSGLVRLDEAHPAHVAGEVVDVRDAVGRPPRHASSERRSATRLSTPGSTWYHSSSGLMSTARRFVKPCLLQVADEPAADESASAGDEDRIVLREIVASMVFPSVALRPGSTPRGLDRVERCRLRQRRPRPRAAASSRSRPCALPSRRSASSGRSANSGQGVAITTTSERSSSSSTDAAGRATPPSTLAAAARATGS